MSVFISYRREDSAGHAGRLFDRLIDRYREDGVFMDHHDLAPGRDFTNEIENHLAAATVVLAIIGPRWAQVRDAHGELRLQKEDDFVRRELSLALRSGKIIIPVLVGGTQFPVESDVPTELAPLLRLQACELRDARFEADLQALLASLPPLNTVFAEQARSLTGTWLAQIQYPWLDSPTNERFDLEQEDDELFGTASFLGAPRPVEEFELLVDGARFVTHSETTLDKESRVITHRYRLRFDGKMLQGRMQSTGGFNEGISLRFQARRDEKSS